MFNKGVLPAQFAAQAQTMVSMMSVKDLKKLITDAGLSHADCIEKADLRVRALETMVAVVDAGGPQKFKAASAGRGGGGGAGRTPGGVPFDPQRFDDEITAVISARFKRHAATADPTQMTQEMEEAVVAARAYKELQSRGDAGKLGAVLPQDPSVDPAFMPQSEAAGSFSFVLKFGTKFRTAKEGSLARSDTASEQVRSACPLGGSGGIKGARYRGHRATRRGGSFGFVRSVARH